MSYNERVKEYTPYGVYDWTSEHVYVYGISELKYFQKHPWLDSGNHPSMYLFIQEDICGMNMAPHTWGLAKSTPFQL